MCDDDGMMLVGSIPWSLQGKRVCRQFWEHAHGLGHVTVDTISKAIREKKQKQTTTTKNSQAIRAGALSAPDVTSADQKERSYGFQASKADAWFLQLHKNLGEPLPDADPDQEKLLSDAVLNAEDIQVSPGGCNANFRWHLAQIRKIAYRLFMGVVGLLNLRSNL